MAAPSPRWQTHFTAEVATWEAEVARRLQIAASDPVAQGIAWAARRLQAAIETLANSRQLLTPAEWGAAQDKPVSAQSVRKWIRLGQLESVPGPQGSLVPATAQRRIPPAAAARADASSHPVTDVAAA